MKFSTRDDFTEAKEKNESTSDKMQQGKKKEEKQGLVKNRPWNKPSTILNNNRPETIQSALNQRKKNKTIFKIAM